MFNLIFLFINIFERMNIFSYSKPCLSTIKKNRYYLKTKTKKNNINKLEKKFKHDPKIITNYDLICKKITWKDYLFVDDKIFDDDVTEMYEKYKCTNEFCNLNTFSDFEKFYDLELISKKLNIFDVCNLFDTKNICKVPEYNCINNVFKDDLSISNKIKDFNVFEKVFELTDIKNLVSDSPDKHQRFYTLFNTIIDDALCIFENAMRYSYFDNNKLEEILVGIKTSQSLYFKIKNFIKFSNEIINSDIQYKKMRKNITIELLLYTRHKKKTYLLKIYNYIAYKFRIFKKYLKKEKFTKNDLLQYTLFYINDIDDVHIRQMCVLGLQGFFNKAYNYTIPKFCKILIFLYAFKNEQHNFNMNWYKQLFKFLSVYSSKNLTEKRISNLFDEIVKDNVFLNYHLYFALNSPFFGDGLEKYKDNQKNKNEVELLNFFIDLITRVKCKLFSINLGDNFSL